MGGLGRIWEGWEDFGGFREDLGRLRRVGVDPEDLHTLEKPSKEFVFTWHNLHTLCDSKVPSDSTKWGKGAYRISSSKNAQNDLLS